MTRPIRTLQLFAFSLVALVIVLGAEASQVFAESFLAQEEDQMLAMVNNHRSDRGLQRLDSDHAYRWVARRHTQRMASSGGIYHNPNLRAEADEAIPGWRLLGENVGTGPSPESVQKAFLNSPKHRANIEDGRFNTAGIGGVAGAEGRRYFTQNFAQWSGPPATPAPPPPTPVVTPAPTAPPAPPATSNPTPAERTAPPPAPVVTPAPATPEAQTSGPEPTPDEDGSLVAAGSVDELVDGATEDAPDEGRPGFFEVLFGLLVRFVEKLWVG